MLKINKAPIAMMLLLGGLLGHASGPAAAAVRIEGRSKRAAVLSRIPLSPCGLRVRASRSNWLKHKPAVMAAFDLAPRRRPAQGCRLYLVAKGGVATVNKGAATTPPLR